MYLITYNVIVLTPLLAGIAYKKKKNCRGLRSPAIRFRLGPAPNQQQLDNIYIIAIYCTYYYPYHGLLLVGGRAQGLGFDRGPSPGKQGTRKVESLNVPGIEGA